MQKLNIAAKYSIAVEEEKEKTKEEAKSIVEAEKLDLNKKLSAFKQEL